MRNDGPRARVHSDMSRLTLFVPVLLAVACGPSADRVDGRSAVAPPGVAAPAAPAGARDTGAARLPTIVILGDSLTAGLGLPVDQAYPALLQARLDEAGLAYHVVNAGVSGDTSAGGLRRLDWVLDDTVAVLVIGLGANDGLRGLPVEEMQQNLRTIIRRAKAKGATVVLAGMEAPPNYGPAYTAAFRQAFRDLARDEQVALIPFLLDGVAGDAALNQGDGIHPNQAGARIVEQNVWTVLQTFVMAAGTR